MADAEWLATAFRAALRKQAGDAPNSQAEAFNPSNPLPKELSKNRFLQNCSRFFCNNLQPKNSANFEFLTAPKVAALMDARTLPRVFMSNPG